MIRAVSPSLSLALSVVLAAGIAACQGCRTIAAGDLGAAATAEPAPTTPTVRLYVLSTIAGALEPCGCSKDQLGGIDHLAAYMASQREHAPNAVVLSVGPTLFLDAKVAGDTATQDGWKAETMVDALKALGLTAWTPGLNDWAAGAETLGKMRERAGAPLLAANLKGAPGAVTSVVREIGGTKIGIVGVSDPRDRAGALPAGTETTAAVEAMRAGLDEVKKQGATIFVGTAALPRGEALRLVDAFPELHVLALGKPAQAGDMNDAPKAPALLGTTLVVEAANHLQTVGVVDLFVRRGNKGAPLVFADAGGVAKADELLGIAQRIRDLENRINSWEHDKSVKPEDVAARKADLDKLRAEKTRLENEQPAASGSFFRYTSVEVRDKMGHEPNVAQLLAGYYKRVNAHNKEAFADKKPAPVDKGKAGYVGVEACTTCHEDERKVWDGTPHANAYATLQKDSKEFNLDCVSCHVTGYGKAGGSTVTYVDKLSNVQCETCHGPGSLHIRSPNKKGLITLAPESTLCTGECHHPPHVEGFDPKEKVKLILGPGHGMD